MQTTQEHNSLSYKAENTQSHKMLNSNSQKLNLNPSQQSTVRTAVWVSLCTLLYTTQHRTVLTRMWANAQLDGHPAEHRWRPLFNAAKFG